MEAFSSALSPDPRAAGKLHARDVVTYAPVEQLAEAESIAFTTQRGEVIDDFSRFRLLDWYAGADVAGDIVWDLVPAEDQRQSGEVSADYFRYTTPAASAPLHQDGFGDYVVIWVLGRTGAGGESILVRKAGGQPVLNRALEPGEVLIFRDADFLHGVGPMRTGTRDVIIFITIKPERYG